MGSTEASEKATQKESSAKTSRTRYICSYGSCAASFDREDRLQHHLRVHTGERPYVCTYEGCGKSYTRKEHLKRHTATIHSLGQLIESSLKCPHCSKSVKTAQNLKKHIKRLHEERVFQCANCQKSFKKHQHLRVHEYHHTGIKPFRCQAEGCDKFFLLPSKLKRHEKVHEGYACGDENCDEHFKSWTALQKHKLLVHVSENKCDSCDRTFTSKRTLKLHAASHAETRPAFHCPYDDCPRYYFFKKNLRQHIRCYHLNKRHMCPHEGCGKSLCNQAKLRQHLKLHEPQGPVPTAYKKKRKARKRRAMASVLSGFQPSKEEERRLLLEPETLTDGGVPEHSGSSEAVATDEVNKQAEDPEETTAERTNECTKMDEVGADCAVSNRLLVQYSTCSVALLVTN